MQYYLLQSGKSPPFLPCKSIRHLVKYVFFECLWCISIERMVMMTVMNREVFCLGRGCHLVGKRKTSPHNVLTMITSPILQLRMQLSHYKAMGTAMELLSEEHQGRHSTPSSNSWAGSLVLWGKSCLLLIGVAEVRPIPARSAIHDAAARVEERQPTGEVLETREGSGRFGPEKKTRGSGNYVISRCLKVLCYASMENWAMKEHLMPWKDAPGILLNVEIGLQNSLLYRAPTPPSFLVNNVHIGIKKKAV